MRNKVNQLLEEKRVIKWQLRSVIITIVIIVMKMILRRIFNFDNEPSVRCPAFDPFLCSTTTICFIPCTLDRSQLYSLTLPSFLPGLQRYKYLIVPSVTPDQFRINVKEVIKVN